MANPSSQRYHDDDHRSLAEIFNSTKRHSFTARDDYLTVNDDDEAVYDNAFKAYRKRSSPAKQGEESTTSQSPSDSSEGEPATIRPERYDIDRSLIDKMAGPGVFSSVIQHRMKSPDTYPNSRSMTRDVGKSRDAAGDISAAKEDVGKSMHELKTEIHEMRAAVEQQLRDLNVEMAHVRALVQETRK